MLMLWYANKDMENILSNMIDMTDIDRLIKRAGVVSSLARIGRKVPTRTSVGKAPIKDIPLSGPSPVRSGHHRQPFYTEEQARMADELGHTRLPTRAEFESINGPTRPVQNKPRFNFGDPNMFRSQFTQRPLPDISKFGVSARNMIGQQGTKNFLKTDIFKMLSDYAKSHPNFKKSLWSNTKPFLLGMAGGTLAGSFNSPSERKVDTWQPYDRSL